MAIFSCGSGRRTQGKFSSSGWRNIALLSIVTLASSSTTSPSALTISGLTSIRVVLGPGDLDQLDQHRSDLIATGGIPRHGERLFSSFTQAARRSTWAFDQSLGSEAAIASTSMPPMRESMTISFLAERSRDDRRVELGFDSEPASTQSSWTFERPSPWGRRCPCR